jgi:hypothetical protein
MFVGDSTLSQLFETPDFEDTHLPSILKEKTAV